MSQETSPTRSAETEAKPDTAPAPFPDNEGPPAFSGEADIDKKARRKLNIVYGCVQSFFLCANGVYFSYLVLYLTTRGYSEFEIGLVMTAVSIVSVFAPSMMGYLADFVIPIKKIVIAMISVSIPLVFLLDAVVAIFPLALLVITTLGITERSMISMLDSWGMKIKQRKSYLNYGLTRGIGSLAFAVATLSVGRIYDLAGIDKLFWIHALFAAISVGFAFFLDDVPVVTKRKEKQSYIQTLLILIKNKKYLILIICMTLHGLSMVSIHTFQPILITQLGGTSTHLGLALFVMAASEAPALFKSKSILEKYKIESVLIFVFFVTILRVLGAVLAPTVEWLIATQALQAVSYGLYLPAVLLYVGLITRDDMTATAITLATSIGIGLSGILGNSLGGLIADLYGIQTVYYIFASLTAVAFLLFTFSVVFSKDKSKQEEIGRT